MAASLGKHVCILLATSSISVVNLKLAVYTNLGLMALRTCLRGFSHFCFWMLNHVIEKRILVQDIQADLFAILIQLMMLQRLQLHDDIWLAKSTCT